MATLAVAGHAHDTSQHLVVRTWLLEPLVKATGSPEPSPFTIAPAASTAIAVTAPVPLPNKIPPHVRQLAPVPPLATAKSVPLQVQLLTVPSTANAPNPKLDRAPLALDAPVPPSATGTSVPPAL